MTDILERLDNMFIRFAAESNDDAAMRRVRTAKDAAEEIKKLREALRLAIETVEFWAAYASSYFQEKHDLAGDLQKLRAALTGGEE